MKQIRDNALYYADIKISWQSDGCTVYELENAEGTGSITSYQVFPGVSLAYNDFHTGKCPQHILEDRDILEINHCREGRFECEFINGLYTYLSEGDDAVNP